MTKLFRFLFVASAFHAGVDFIFDNCDEVDDCASTWLPSDVESTVDSVHRVDMLAGLVFIIAWLSFNAVYWVHVRSDFNKRKQGVREGYASRESKVEGNKVVPGGFCIANIIAEHLPDPKARQDILESNRTRSCGHAGT